MLVKSAQSRAEGTMQEVWEKKFRGARFLPSRNDGEWRLATGEW